MCGIAGAINLTDRRPFPGDALRAMASSLIHRGPDEDGYLEQDGIGFASRRLSIVGLADGRQPISNEDRNVFVVYNGEFFDYPELRAKLESRGHRFRTHCDTEVIPHSWEDDHEQMFEHLRGQFALALWDQRRNQVILARDRFGICPLYWTRQKHDGCEWLLFASEIKGLLASGMVPARPDPRGINHAFTFFAIPGPVTCFEGIQLLPPGHYLDIRRDHPDGPAKVAERVYWELEFPDRGQEDYGTDQKKLVDRFEELFIASVTRRLRADVPVVSYLSGGVDSSTVVALASHVRGTPIPTFTIQVADPRLDETSEAAQTARHVGSNPVVVRFGAAETLQTYPELIRAAEGPVIDTSCGAMLMLAREVHARGYKVALTGEGADEWLPGYPWYKVHKLLGCLDMIPGLPLGYYMRAAYLRYMGAPKSAYTTLPDRALKAIAGPSAWLDTYGMMSNNRWLFYSPRMLEAVGDHVPFEDMPFNQEKMRRWHPLNRALYIGARVHLPGLLLNHKGDRVAMNSSVETRYPFLDEDICTFLAGLHPRWKLRGFREKYILRLLAERWLPKEVAWRRKAMFHAPFDSFHAEHLPPFVDQLLSEESLRRAGYFDPHSVRHWRQAFRELRPRSYRRTFLEMGLVAVVATQLWHHTFIEASLADLPSQAPSSAVGPGWSAGRIPARAATPLPA